MTDDISLTKLRYLECQKGQMHSCEQLNMICVEPNCKENGLICSICRVEQHSSHKVIPLKIFLSQVSQKMKNRNHHQSNLDQMLLKVDSLNQNFLFTLKETVESLALAIKNFEQEFSNTTKRIREKIITQNFMNENMPKVIESILHNEYCEADELKQECKKLVDSITYSDKRGIEIETRPEKSIETFGKVESEVAKCLVKISKTFIDSIKQLEKTIEKTVSARETSTQSQFTFSSLLKSSTISILEDKFAIQNFNQNLENRLVLLEPQLSLEGSPTKFAIKVKYIDNCVGLGICFKSIIEKNDYKFLHSTIGQGSYIITSNGHCWSHSQKKEHGIKGFGFQNEDIITCELDSSKKKITFKKLKSESTIALTVDIPEGEEVYACVTLCGKGDKVEIVNNLEIQNDELF